jgi:tRNA(fMet)-specific endonuclease VapC
MKWMLDTVTCIALIRRRPPTLIQRLQSKAVGDVGISAITLAELRHGVAKSMRRDQNRSALDQFLLPLDIAAFDELAADSYGIVRAALEADGMPIGPLDTLIAGHAVSLNVVLVTHNVSEFKRVVGLRVDDWLESA